MKLTEGNLTKVVRAAQANSKSNTDYVAWDDELHGFGLRTRNGKRT